MAADLLWALLWQGVWAAPAGAVAWAHLRRRRGTALWLTIVAQDGPHPISWLSLAAEFNGSVDLPGAVRGLVGGEGPLSEAGLEAASRLVRADASLFRQVVLGLAAEKLACHLPPREALETLERLTPEIERLGFYAFMRELSTALAPSGARLWPLASYLRGAAGGGLPLPLPGRLGPGLLESAYGLLTSGLAPEAVEGFQRAWREKRVDGAYRKELARLGAAIKRSLALWDPAGERIAHNVRAPYEAYQALREEARRRKRPREEGWLAHALDGLLERDITRAAALAHARSEGLLAALSGRHGAEEAGLLLLAHPELREGLAPGALPIEAASRALAARQALDQ